MCRNGQESRKQLFFSLCFMGIDIGRQGYRTFSVYEDLCAISVRPHQNCLIVYLFLR